VNQKQNAHCKSKVIETRKNYKPTISQDLSVDKVIKISDNADGTIIKAI
jgi:hypothetical protein